MKREKVQFLNVKSKDEEQVCLPKIVSDTFWEERVGLSLREDYIRTGLLGKSLIVYNNTSRRIRLGYYAV